MKKILILLSALFLSGCGSCLLSQNIPPQKIYAGAGCQAPLPNYLLKIAATDNCEISSLTQTPAAGFMLTAAAKTATVTVKATDASGNFRQIAFTVTLLDTIRPVFTVDPSLLTAQAEQMKDAYNFADKLTAFNLENVDKAIFDESIFPEAQFPNLRNVYEDSTYFKRKMITWTSPAFALTGKGGRYTTFISDQDTVIIQKKTP